MKTWRSRKIAVSEDTLAGPGVMAIAEIEQVTAVACDPAVEFRGQVV